MHRERFYLSATLHGQGRRPPQLVTLHPEGESLVVAISSPPGRRALRNPPSRNMVWHLQRVVGTEVGECSFGEWEPFHETDGELAGWMASVSGSKVSAVRRALASD